MAQEPVQTPQARPEDRYDEACDAWRCALEQYLRLAREGAGGTKLRAAAAAVHAAALRKGRLARSQADAGG